MFFAQSVRRSVGRLLRWGKGGYAGLGKFHDTPELGISLPRFDDGPKRDAALEDPVREML